MNGGGIVVAANGGVSGGACSSYEWGLICSRVEEVLTTMAGTQLGSFDVRKTRVCRTERSQLILGPNKIAARREKPRSRVICQPLSSSTGTPLLPFCCNVVVQEL